MLEEMLPRQGKRSEKDNLVLTDHGIRSAWLTRPGPSAMSQPLALPDAAFSRVITPYTFVFRK